MFNATVRLFKPLVAEQTVRPHIFPDFPEEAEILGRHPAAFTILELPTFCRPNPRDEAVVDGTNREIDQLF